MIGSRFLPFTLLLSALLLASFVVPPAYDTLARTLIALGYSVYELWRARSPFSIGMFVIVLTLTALVACFHL